jgi:hypothetical protein
MTLGIGIKTAIAVGALGLSGGAVATGVVSPSEANDHAVVTQATPNPHASFGQCVAANAKTAGERHSAAKGKLDWNPTDGCDKPGNAGGAHGLENARSHANAKASPGLDKAATQTP